MKILTDHSFHIGEQHLRQGKPCQDYASSGTLTEGVAYAMVSDGCSSGGMTDFGSRLVSMAVLRCLEERGGKTDWTMAEFNAGRDAYLESYRASLRLQHNDLFATSLFAISDDTTARIGVVGDGVVALKYEGGLVAHTFSWAKNTPYYPSYRIGNLDPSFIDAHQDEAEPLTMTTVMKDEVNTTTNSTCRYTTSEGMRGLELKVLLNDETLGNLGIIALFSDGVEQIDQVEQDYAIDELLAFKSSQGQFAVRRMNRFMQGVRKQGRGPLDDISYAVIHYTD